MADSPNELYLASPETVPESLFGCLDMLPGRVAVAMYAGESRGGILMPLSGRLSPDIGVVVASGCSLMEGQEALVRPYTGAWYDNFHGSGFQVRLFGVIEPWYESIPAMRMGNCFMPTHDWVLIERHRDKATILLHDELSKTCGTVVGIGPECTEVRSEDRVMFKTPEDGFLTFKFGKDMDDWCLIREENLLLRLE